MKEIVFMLRKKLVMAICLALFAALVPINLAAAEGFDYNPTDSGSRIGTALLTDYWMDNSKAAESLNEYLRAVTDETSPDYIPRENRNLPLLLRVHGFHGLRPEPFGGNAGGRIGSGAGDR